LVLTFPQAVVVITAFFLSTGGIAEALDWMLGTLVALTRQALWRTTQLDYVSHSILM
jgi:hypothetical protein